MGRFGVERGDGTGDRGQPHSRRAHGVVAHRLGDTDDRDRERRRLARRVCVHARVYHNEQHRTGVVRRPGNSAKAFRRCVRAVERRRPVGLWRALGLRDAGPGVQDLLRWVLECGAIHRRHRTRNGHPVFIGPARLKERERSDRPPRRGHDQLRRERVDLGRFELRVVRGDHPERAKPGPGRGSDCLGVQLRRIACCFRSIWKHEHRL